MPAPIPTNMATSPAPAKKPWPMRWIVLAIVLYVLGYTAINIAYRKPASESHEPYAEARERESRMVHASMQGWARLHATPIPRTEVSDPASISARALSQPLAREIPLELAGLILREPTLHPAAIQLSTPSRTTVGQPLVLRLEIPHPSTVPPFGETLAYYKDNHLYIFLQDTRNLPPGFSPLPPDSVLTLALDPASLPPGSWQATAFTASQILSWNFTVEPPALP